MNEASEADTAESNATSGEEAAAPPRRPRRFGFRFRIQLLFGAIITSVIAWFIGAQYNTAVRQKATAELLAAGARIDERSTTHAPGVLISLLGEDFFSSPVAFTFTGKVTAPQLEPLQRLPARSLDLSLVSVGDDGARQIAQASSLRELFLKEAGLTDEGGAALAALKNLEKLELSGNSTGPKTAEAVGTLPQLKRLWLNDTQTGDAELQAIARCRQLEMLALNNTLVTNKGLKVLVELPELDSLHLSGTAVDDAGLRHLGAMTGLGGTLDLSNCLITDKGIRQLAALTYLRSLDLSGCDLSEEAVAQLRRTLPKCAITFEKR